MTTLAIIGLGYWGPNLARNFGASARTRVGALCDRDAKRLESQGRRFPGARLAADPAEVFADPAIDAVAIATPVATHFALAKAALLAGKHVLVEKPMTASSAEAEELVALARDRGRVLLVDHVFVYSPPVRKLAAMVRSGELGDLQFFDSVRINLGLFQHDVNVVWDLAPHDVAIIDHLVGRPARSVVAFGASHARDGMADVAYLHVDYGDALVASVHVNWLSPVKVRHFMVGGSRRSVLWDDLDVQHRVKVYDRGIDVARDPEGRRDVLISYRTGDMVAPNLPTTEPLGAMVDHFADCIEGKAAPESGGEQGLRVVRILEAAQRSLDAGGARVAL